MARRIGQGSNAASSSGAAPTGAAGGDLSGTYPDPTVAKLNGVAASAYAPKASPTFTGTVDASGATVTLPSGLVLPASVSIPTSAVAVTQSAADAGTKVATTAYADRAAGLRVANMTTQRTGTVAMTYARNLANNGAIAIGATGQLGAWLIEVPPATTIGSIYFTSGGTAASGPTHQWAALCDASFNLLAISADATNAAWGTNTEKRFQIANIASGAASTYTTTNTIPAAFYVCLLVTASSTIPTMAGIATQNSANTKATTGGGSITSGTGSALTTPSTFATQYTGTFTAQAGTPLVELTAT